MNGNKIDKRIFKKEGEELQQYLHFRKRGGSVKPKKGKGSFDRRNFKKDIDKMLLRVIIENAGGDHVRVNLPVALIKVAIETGMAMPKINSTTGSPATGRGCCF